MIVIGDFNWLKANRTTDNGVYLICEDDEEVLLPNKYVPADLAMEDMLDVFIYKDSEDRTIATTLEPYAIVGEFACLQVKEVNSIGAFLDWGLEKDLLIPFAEQRAKMVKGYSYIIYVYLDENSGRIAGTNKYGKHLQKENFSFTNDDEVEILVAEKTELGYNVIINDIAKGLLFHNEIHQPIRMGDRLPAYIKRVREDHKIDISLQKSGMEQVDLSAKKVLLALAENDGFLPLTDKSSPEIVKQKLGMSKKTFKKSIGKLYKQKMILLTDEGIKAI